MGFQFPLNGLKEKDIEDGDDRYLYERYKRFARRAARVAVKPSRTNIPRPYIPKGKVYKDYVSLETHI